MKITKQALTVRDTSRSGRVRFLSFWSRYFSHTVSLSCLPVSNVSDFQLPDTSGRAGGALSSALLSVVAEANDLTFQQVLLAIRDKLQQHNFVQIPQLSSSRPTNLNEKFTIVPENFSGKRRAVLIGINYTGLVSGWNVARQP